MIEHNKSRIMTELIQLSWTKATRARPYSLHDRKLLTFMPACKRQKSVHHVKYAHYYGNSRQIKHIEASLLIDDKWVGKYIQWKYSLETIQSSALINFQIQVFKQFCSKVSSNQSSEKSSYKSYGLLNSFQDMWCCWNIYTVMPNDQ